MKKNILLGGIGLAIVILSVIGFFLFKENSKSVIFKNAVSSVAKQFSKSNFAESIKQKESYDKMQMFGTMKLDNVEGFEQMTFDYDVKYDLKSNDTEFLMTIKNDDVSFEMGTYYSNGKSYITYEGIDKFIETEDADANANIFGNIFDFEEINSNMDISGYSLFIEEFANLIEENIKDDNIVEEKATLDGKSLTKLSFKLEGKEATDFDKKIVNKLNENDSYIEIIAAMEYMDVEEYREYITDDYYEAESISGQLYLDGKDLYSLEFFKDEEIKFKITLQDEATLNIYTHEDEYVSLAIKGEKLSLKCYEDDEVVSHIEMAMKKVSKTEFKGTIKLIFIEYGEENVYEMDYTMKLNGFEFTKIDQSKVISEDDLTDEDFYVFYEKFADLGMD